MPMCCRPACLLLPCVEASMFCVQAPHTLQSTNRRWYDIQVEAFQLDSSRQRTIAASGPVVHCQPMQAYS